MPHLSEALNFVSLMIAVIVEHDGATVFVMLAKETAGAEDKRNQKHGYYS